MKYTLTAFFLFVASLAFASNQDSLYQAYSADYKKANELLASNPEKASILYQQCFNTLETLLRNSETNGFFAFRNDFMEEYEEKMHLLEVSKELIAEQETNKKPQAVIAAYESIIQIVTWQGKSEERFKWNFEALQYAQSIRDTARIIHYSVSIADLNSMFHSMANARKHFLKANEYLKAYSGDKKDIEVRYWQRYAAHKNTLEELDSAIYYSHKALLLLGKDGTHEQKGISYNELAFSYNRIEELKEALLYSNKAIECWKYRSDEESLTIAYINLANTLYKINRTEEYIDALEKSLRGGMANGIFWVAEAASWKLSKQYYQLQDYKKAYLYLRIGKFVTSFDEKLSKVKETLLVEAEYEMTDNVETIEAQKAHIQLVEREKEEQRWYRMFTQIIAILFALIIVLVIVYSMKLRRKQAELSVQKTLVAQQNKQLSNSLHQNETLLKEVHHRVKNNLAILSGLFYLQERAVDNEVDRGFLQECQNRIHSMALVHQKLYQSDEMDAINFDTYCNELINTVATGNAPKDKTIVHKVNCNGLKLDIDIAVPLALMITELITNSYKHAFRDQLEGEIGVLLSQKDGHYELHVYDNGKGIENINEIDQSKSLGMRLIKILSRQLFGEARYVNDEKSSFFLTFAA